MFKDRYYCCWKIIYPVKKFPQVEDFLSLAPCESELLSAIKNAGLATDQERMDEYTDRFLEHADHLHEVDFIL